jgi:hypothetical protein
MASHHCSYLPCKPRMCIDFGHGHALLGFQGQHATNQSYKRVGGRHGKRRVNVQSAFVLKLVHGSSLNISPERYLQNSALLSVGSSHGVSEQRVGNIPTVDTCDTYSHQEVRTG